MAELLLDWLGQDPGPSGAVLQGILFGRTAPEHAVRCQLETPALVIGHPRDPVHPFSDADMLAAELPNATLLDANSILELRTHPKRLTTRIAAFVDECWEGADEVGLRRASAAGA
jgi:pimeloyl-ACP methyl ester carboxylesterase